MDGEIPGGDGRPRSSGGRLDGSRLVETCSDLKGNPRWNAYKSKRSRVRSRFGLLTRGITSLAQATLRRGPRAWVILRSPNKGTRVGYVQERSTLRGSLTPRTSERPFLWAPCRATIFYIVIYSVIKKKISQKRWGLKVNGDRIVSVFFSREKQLGPSSERVLFDGSRPRSSTVISFIGKILGFLRRRPFCFISLSANSLSLYHFLLK